MPVRLLQRHGFTLVEVLLTIIILSVGTIAVSEIMVRGMNAYGLISARRVALQGARIAMTKMVRELSIIEDPVRDMTMIDFTELRFRSEDGKSVRYVILNGRLMRDGDLLADHVTSMSGFRYYAADGSITHDRRRVARIEFLLEVDTGEPAWGKVFLQDQIYLRNLYYERFSH